MSITLDQIKEAKKKAESAIVEVFEQFEKETGFKKYSVSIDVYNDGLEPIINTVSVNIHVSI